MVIIMVARHIVLLLLFFFSEQGYAQKVLEFLPKQPTNTAVIVCPGAVIAG